MEYIVMKLTFKKTLLAGLISCVGATATQFAYSSVVREDVDYQDFRDFAENKGRFTVGATNIQVHDKDGNLLGEVLNGAPMPDLSATSHIGTHTVFDPQYVVSVAHNERVGFRSMNFGIENNSRHNDADRFNYMFVRLNTYPSYDGGGVGDYYIPRLHKLVTEVAPIPIADLGKEEDYTTKQKYSAFVRVGSGHQGTMYKHIANATTSPLGTNTIWQCYSNTKDCKNLSGAYNYLIGGEMLGVLIKTNFPDDEKDAYIETMGEVRDDKTDGFITSVYTSPMAFYSQSGDSGSPVLAYNKNTKQWELIATTRGGINRYVTYNKDAEKWDLGWSRHWVSEVLALARPHFHKEIIDNNTITIQNNQSDVLTWQTQNATSSTITQANSTLNHTVPLVTQLVNNHDNVPDANVTEVRDLDTGKTLHFTGQDGTLELTSSINQGAGALYFDNNFTVRTSNPADTWLGAGVSVAKDKTVTWQVKNPENDRLSKIGEGTLVVNGVGENKGDISVGDGTVILNQQADSNGNKQAFNKVGIVSGRATVKLMDSEQIDPNKLYFGYRGGRLDLNGNNLTFNYIRNFDQGARLVNHHPSQKATITVVGDDTKDRAFNGVLGESDNSKNGQSDVVYNPTAKQQQHNQAYTWLLSGGSQLNGNLTVQAGTVLLSGRPTPHAYDLINQKEVIKDDSWLNRSFTAQNFNVQGDGQLQISRNVTNVTGNINAQDQATVKLGYQQGDTVCIRSDYHGGVNCNVANYTDNVLNSIPSVQFTGNLNLKDNSQITLGKAHMIGSANASQTSQINLSPQAHWTMTNTSQVGNLAMTQGSQITLNTQPNQQYNTLTITGNLTGAGQFNYLTNLTENKSDKVVVQGTAEGQYGLYVQNSGTEPVYREQHLTLLSLQNANQTNKQVNVELLNPNKTVDLGAYRYTLENNGQDYYLYNPYLSVKEVTQKGESVKADALKPYDGEISTKGSGVTHELPVGHLEMKGESVKADALKPYDGIITTKGESVKAEPLPAGHLEIKGSGVTYELPVGHLEMKGESVKADALKPYDGIITTKGESVKAEPLPAIDIQTVLNTTTPQLPTVTPPQSAVISRYANTALSDLSAQAHQVIDIGQNLQQRLNQSQTKGLWLDVEHSKTQYQSDLYRPYETTDTTTNLGIGGEIPTPNGTLTLGGAWTHSQADHQYDDAIKGKSEVNLASVYGKYETANRNFMTFDVSYGTSDNQINPEQSKQTFERDIASVGVGVGHQFNTPWVNITPTASVRYHHLSGANYNLDGADVAVDKAQLVSYQTGLQIDKDFTLASGLKVKPSLSSRYVDTQSTQDNQPVVVNGHGFNQNFGRYHTHDLGLSVGKSLWETAVHVGMTDGDEIDKQTSANVLLRYQW